MDDLDQQLDRRIERLEKLSKEGVRGNSNSSTITVNLGVNGWLAGFSIAMMLVFAWLIFEDRQVIREHQYQFNALYARYPYLQPEKKP